MLLLIFLESVLLLAYLACMLALLQFGTVGQRAFSSGAALAPLAFALFIFRHSPFDPSMYAIVEGTYLGPLLLDTYGNIWWVALWMPISIGLGFVSLQTRRRLAGGGPQFVSTEQSVDTKPTNRD